MAEAAAVGAARCATTKQAVSVSRAMLRGGPARKRRDMRAVTNSSTRASVAASSSITIQRRFSASSLLDCVSAPSPSSC